MVLINIRLQFQILLEKLTMGSFSSRIDWRIFDVGKILIFSKVQLTLINKSKCRRTLSDANPKGKHRTSSFEQRVFLSDDFPTWQSKWCGCWNGNNLSIQEKFLWCSRKVSTQLVWWWQLIKCFPWERMYFNGI